GPQPLGGLAPGAQPPVGLGSAPCRLGPLPRGKYPEFPNDGPAAQGQPSEAPSHSIAMSRVEPGSCGDDRGRRAAASPCASESVIWPQRRSSVMRQSWRDTIAIHPAAELFPLLCPDELRALGAAILRNGLTPPIVLWRPQP